MAVNLSPIGNGFQFFTILGQPLAGGKIYTYQAGSSTPLATYTDNTGSVANANPIVLGTDGRPADEIWLTYGYNYKFILKDANDTTIQSYDNLYGIIGVQPTTGATIPAGMIAMWSGSIGSIPSGWYLCDGSNGTPNLTDRFIIGAGSSYAVNGNGGVATNTLVEANIPAHTHTATSTVTDPTHTHNILGTSNHYVADGGQGSGGTGTFPFSLGSTSYGSSYIQNASTGITVATTNASTGSGTSFTNIPPYYALAFIQKS
jgi:microcystin-dependent protein